VIVIDASVLLPALLDGGGSGALARTALAGASQRHAPALLDLEVTAGVRSKLARGDIEPASAASAVADLVVYPVERHDHRRLLPRVWSLRDNVTAYDAAYVALAEVLDATLLTADQRLAAVPGLRCAVRVLAV